MLDPDWSGFARCQAHVLCSVLLARVHFILHLFVLYIQDYS